MADSFRFADELGPQKTVSIYQPSAGLKAIVVIDNVAAGPAIGGTRMAPDVTQEECFRLARAMTFKNAVAGIPHGGAKSVIVGDPGMPAEEKEKLIRAFAFAIRDLADYIPGPDMGTNELAMAWIRDENGRAVGLPRVVGGIPLDEIGSTGYGLSVAAKVAEEFGGPKLKGARIAIQGFGAVGKHAAKYLAESGSVLVAVADSRGTIADSDGLDVSKLIALKDEGGAVTEYENGRKSISEDIVGVDCDILIPAARPDVIHMENVDNIKARLVLQGANIPATSDAEMRLHERGILCIPDIIANAGGVITAAVEYQHGSQAAAMEMTATNIERNTREVLRMAADGNVLPRQAAQMLARQRIESAAATRRFK